MSLKIKKKLKIQHIIDFNRDRVEFISIRFDNIFMFDSSSFSPCHIPKFIVFIKYFLFRTFIAL